MWMFMRDVAIGMGVMYGMLLAFNWYNAPAYKACAKSHSQEFCYVVLR
jgi:hypothetical protein